MASIRPRRRKSDGGTTYAVLYRHRGKQTGTSFDSLDEAEKFKALIDLVGVDAAVASLDIEAPPAPLLVDFLESYVATRTGVEQGTTKKYRAYIANDFADLGDLMVSEVTETVVAAWLNSLDGAAKTIANKHGFLSAALEQAVRAGHLASNPCAHSTLPQGLRKPPFFFSAAQFTALEAAMPEQWRTHARFLAASGVRFSESTALTVGDVDLAEGTVRVEKAFKYTGSNRLAKLSTTKTRRGVRTINVPASVLELLDLDRDPFERLFQTQAGTRITSQAFHNRAWKPALDRLDAAHRKAEGEWVALDANAQKASPRPRHPLGGKRPHPHDLRHTCASWMIAAGVPLPAIQAHLGHESIKTTVDLYGSLDRNAGRRAAAAISAVFDGSADWSDGPVASP
ncbi:tyrosine-type recombinase/integrase [Tsukamurella sp. NPDC003166]|uniref:tyrosine-type recombinase/integrase n=1 Tax=Tsukamurella sp. NPDC003166 TaxID=3154444 RepID=UPI0033B2A483